MTFLIKNRHKIISILVAILFVMQTASVFSKPKEEKMMLIEEALNVRNNKLIIRVGEKEIKNEATSAQPLAYIN